MKLKVLAVAIMLILIGSVFVGAVNAIDTNKKIEHNLEIHGSTGEWVQINEDGFGSKENAGIRGIEIFSDNVVIGTANFNYKSGIVLDKPMPIRDFLFEYRENGSALNNYKSNGCEIWAYNETTFRPIVAENGLMSPGFGNKENAEIGIIIKFGNYLYAGTRNYVDGCQIWRTDDLESEWENVIDDGFGNINNTWAMEAQIFKDYLYIGTFNMRGTEIFRSNDGVTWEQVVGNNSIMKSGFGTHKNFYAWSMCVLNDILYVGTNNGEYGGELWKSGDGVNWSPIIANAEGALYPLDFTKNGGYHGGIRNMILYNNELYLGFTAEDTIFNFGLKNFGRFKIGIPIALPQKHSFLRRIKTMGLEIYKFNDNTNELMRVIGGLFRGVFSGGFGDDHNEYPWSMHVYNDMLYVGTSHPFSYDIVFERVGFFKYEVTVKVPIGGGELWRYNGASCEQINSDGFGDLYNTGIRELTVYNGKLIAGVLNVKTGCEVWKCDLGDL